MSTATCNLARKWRSKKFDQIIGQDLCVRILKNSLYKNHIFPVYLFSGQHGCGKTTTARVFAAALNCQQLSLFQQDPQNIVLPCLTCTSCTAMTGRQHPDFIEIDAASNTGVDTVRSLIDAASLLPVMGGKKVYLIDEVHMLSKSAFNAFLKVLEEPPSSVVFILATTDPQKILETVRSRCFQLFFDPVAPPVIQNHLQVVCTQEAIVYESRALSLIAQESKGSVRDALNILEQVRFASGSLTSQTVKTVLGHIDEEEFVRLIKVVVSGDVQRLLTMCKELQLETKSVEFLWHKMVALIRELLWRKYKVTSGLFGSHEQQLRMIVTTISTETIHAMLQLLYSNELLFNKTIAQYELFEMILLQMAHLCAPNNDSSNTPPNATTSLPVVDETQVDATDEESHDEDEDESDESGELTHYDTDKEVWDTFLQLIRKAHEPLLSSIFSQVLDKRYDLPTSTLYLTFSQEHTFFTTLLDQCSNIWKPLLVHATGSKAATFDISFSSKLAPRKLNQKIVPERILQKNSTPQPVNATSTTSFDITDVQKWPKTNLVLHYFPGTVKEVQGA